MDKLKSMIDVYFDTGIFNPVEIFKDVNCILCNNTLKDNNNAIKTKCKHYFHSNCLDNWFYKLYKNKYINKNEYCRCPECGHNIDMFI